LVFALLVIVLALLVAATTFLNTRPAPIPDSESNVFVTASFQVNTGEEVFKRVCSTCHTIDRPTDSEVEPIAPPMRMVARRYLMMTESPEVANARIIEWLEGPDAEKSLMPPMAIEHHGLMPPVVLTEEERVAVAEFVLSLNEGEEGGMMNGMQHQGQKKGEGEGQGMMMHQGQNGQQGQGMMMHQGQNGQQGQGMMMHQGQNGQQGQSMMHGKMKMQGEMQMQGEGQMKGCNHGEGEGQMQGCKHGEGEGQMQGCKHMQGEGDGQMKGCKHGEGEGQMQGCKHMQGEGDGQMKGCKHGEGEGQMQGCKHNKDTSGDN